jgi:hypothetical protein
LGNPPYNVSQLQAMQWAKAAWSDVLQSAITHCWHHATLLSPGAANPTCKVFFVQVYFLVIFYYPFFYSTVGSSPQ